MIAWRVLAASDTNLLFDLLAVEGHRWNHVAHDLALFWGYRNAISVPNGWRNHLRSHARVEYCFQFHDAIQHLEQFHLTEYGRTHFGIRGFTGAHGCQEAIAEFILVENGALPGENEVGFLVCVDVLRSWTYPTFSSAPRASPMPPTPLHADKCRPDLGIWACCVGSSGDAGQRAGRFRPAPHRSGHR